MGKSDYLQIRLTPEEKETLQREADQLGLSMAAFLVLLLRNYSNGVEFRKVAVGQ